jgi:hypothetical protein
MWANGQKKCTIPEGLQQCLWQISSRGMLFGPSRNMPCEHFELSICRWPDGVIVDYILTWRLSGSVGDPWRTVLESWSP